MGMYGFVCAVWDSMGLNWGEGFDGAMWYVGDCMGLYGGVEGCMGLCGL